MHVAAASQIARIKVVVQLQFTMYALPPQALFAFVPPASQYLLYLSDLKSWMTLMWYFGHFSVSKIIHTLAFHA